MRARYVTRNPMEESPRTNAEWNGENAAEGSERYCDRRDFLARIGHGLVACIVGVPASSTVPSNANASTRLATIADLRKQLRGTVVHQDSPDYEAWRHSMAWQPASPPRFPAVIVQAANEEDVILAVHFARETGLKVVTRTGGHSYCSSFLQNGSLLIDVSRLQALEVDPRAAQVIVQPGVFGRTLNATLARHGLAFPTAHCGDVPLGGYLVGGGQGWNGNEWGGMSALNVSALDIVTADGRLHHATASADPDLFWAARGGGAAVPGVVTRFYLHCYPLPKVITKSEYTFAFDNLRAFTDMMETLGTQCPRGVELMGFIAEPSPGLTVSWSGTGFPRVCVLQAIAFAMDKSEAARMLLPVSQHPLMAQAIQTAELQSTDLESLYRESDFARPRLRGDNIYTDRLSEAVAAMKDRVVGAPSAAAEVLMLYKGKPVPNDAACLSSGRFYLAIYAQWEEELDEPTNVSWLQSVMTELRPFAKGSYINEFDSETHPELISQCFSEAAWARLKDLQERLDPTHVFLGFPVQKPPA
jgi:FAD/FMN-containing dehydrogenase